MTKHETIKAMVERLRDLFPEDSTGSMGVEYRSYGSVNAVNVHGFKDYELATEFLRGFGCGIRHKTVYDEGRCTLSGIVDGVEYTVFVDALPPTCRIEKVVERIPKQQTVDTGEFIEVERTKVVCSETVHV